MGDDGTRLSHNRHFVQSQNIMKHTTTTIFLLLALAIAFLTPGTLRSDSTNRAGLVIVSGDGTAHTFCFDLGADGQTTGARLLLASGMEMIVQGDPSVGMIVCKIGIDGCTYPQENCFCDPVDYWSYWHLVNGAWSYSGTGASEYTVKHGDVDGWAWSQTMPTLTFQDICTASTTPIPLPTVATSTPTATPAPTATPTATPSTTPTATATSEPTATPEPTAMPSVTPTATAMATAMGTATVQATLTPTLTVSPTNVATSVSTSVVSPTAVLTATPVVQTPTMTASSGRGDETDYPVYLPIITRGGEG